MVLFGWIADTPDPNDFLTSMLAKSSLGNSNAVRWSNSAFDSLLAKARYQSINDRLQTYQDAQKIFYEDMPFVPIANALQLNAWNQRVRGYVWHPTTSRLYLHKVWLSP